MKVFDTFELTVVEEINLFPDRDNGRHRTKEIQQMLIINDKNRRPYIAISRL